MVPVCRIIPASVSGVICISSNSNKLPKSRKRMQVLMDGRFEYEKAVYYTSFACLAVFV